MRQLRLLLVEDSEIDATLLLEYLKQGGYEPDCTRVDSAKALGDALYWNSWLPFCVERVDLRFDGNRIRKIQGKQKILFQK